MFAHIRYWDLTCKFQHCCHYGNDTIRLRGWHAVTTDQMLLNVTQANIHVSADCKLAQVREGESMLHLENFKDTMYFMNV